MKEYSPFTHGIPVSLEFFVGRAAELLEIIQLLGPYWRDQNENA
jgi:hypothetical protein